MPSTTSIIKKIKDLKTNSAPGDDGITTSMLKRAKGTIAPILATLVKCVVDIGYFPDILKKTKVKMLHKKGSKQILKNYRPIALTSILGKLIESIITDELVRQLEESGIINQSQHEFRRNTGCHTALLSMWDGVTNYVETHGGCSMVGLDMT